MDCQWDRACHRGRRVSVAKSKLTSSTVLFLLKVLILYCTTRLRSLANSHPNRHSTANQWNSKAEIGLPVKSNDWPDTSTRSRRPQCCECLQTSQWNCDHSVETLRWARLSEWNNQDSIPGWKQAACTCRHLRGQHSEFHSPWVFRASLCAQKRESHLLANLRASSCSTSHGTRPQWF